MNLKDLKRVMHYKWKPGQKVGKKLQCIAYIDARQARDLLDEVVGPENWSSQYEEVKGNLYCGVGIKINRPIDSTSEWVWKWDCGTESRTDAEDNQKKGEASDAFKRACVQWGIGRFLYELSMVKLDIKDYKGKDKPATSSGKILWSGKEVTDYINGLQQPSKPTGTPLSFGGESPKNNKPTGRYNADKGGEDVKYQKTHNFSDNTIKKVQGLEKDGKKGREVLLDHLEAFNEVKKKKFSKISELSDTELQDLINFIEGSPPSNI